MDHQGDGSDERTTAIDLIRTLKQACQEAERRRVDVMQEVEDLKAHAADLVGFAKANKDLFNAWKNTKISNIRKDIEATEKKLYHLHDELEGLLKTNPDDPELEDFLNHNLDDPEDPDRYSLL
ncbi:hypothetical protein LTR37_018256 [Vermiconidia calcicola]|uniref:Uncharacterized protein n=1 Tax=Vermiconidia calcicola TaxID=1690605 RepID=A0ACC3MJE3_9PEZI|nr:hypothetical protein LTR37_018256 [Vermiconidia calcicola]